MLIVLALHFVVASGAPWLFARWGRHAFYVLAAVPAGSFIWLLFQHNAVYSPGATGPPTELVPWVPDLQLELAFRMDALAWLMSLLVLGVGALVLVYCARYFKSDDGGLGGFGAQLLAFAGVMFGLVTADNLLLLYRLLGTDHRPVLPADRVCADPDCRPAGGPAGADGHHRWAAWPCWWA